MKKLLLFLIISVACFFSDAQTNVYHPFPDSNGVWCDAEWRHVCPIVPPDILRKTTYQLDGTVQIDSFIYHRLSRYKISVVYDFCNIPNTYIDTTPYFMRQDTALKKVFLYDFGIQGDTTLYDFNLQVGDTMTRSRIIWGSTPATDFPYIVVGIDSILIDGLYRKRFAIQNNDSIGPCPYNGTYLIEGIGSVNGLTLTPACFEYGAELKEFIQDNHVLYGANDTFLVTYNCSAYSLPNAVKSISENTISFTVFPNPFHTTAIIKTENIEFNNAVPRAFGIKIYNTLGVLVREEKILNLSSYILHRDGLNDGLYFYELKAFNSELIGTGKFVIQ